MEQILLTILIPSFLAFWIIVVILYTPACFTLRTMIDLIDEEGELKTNKIEWSLGGNSNTVSNWLISIPTSDKYLQYDKVKTTIDKIRVYRRMIGILGPIIIICAVILTNVIEN